MQEDTQTEIHAYPSCVTKMPDLLGILLLGFLGQQAINPALESKYYLEKALWDQGINLISLTQRERQAGPWTRNTYNFPTDLFYL